jgi:tRNA(Ile)-lysidine synthase
MASSKKLRPSDLPGVVESKLKQWQVPGRHLLLALSGGADSVVLLDILAQLRSSLYFQLSALHVNHQISPHAAQWAAFCAELCAALQIPFQTVTVELGHRRGESLEALARAARYRVLAEQPADFIALAQHLDDQAETLLLQLLRGAGAKGLSGMGEWCEGTKTGRSVQGHRPEPTIHRQPVGSASLEPTYLRPLLDVPRRLILDYAAAQDLQWVEDESNADLSYDRNFLRHRIMPELGQRFPGYRETFARAARNLAESAELLDDLAQLDGAAAIAEGRLKVAALGSLSLPRGRNLLRYWLDRCGVRMPSAIRLENILHQLCGARDDAQIRIIVGEAVIRRFRGEAHVEFRQAHAAHELERAWNLDGVLELPECGGCLRAERIVGQGLSLARLGEAGLTVRLRQGGERLRPDCRRPRRSLKKLMQEADMPPWQRQHLPLLFSGDRLVFVPGLGVDCDFQAQAGEPGVVVLFEPLG